MGLYPQNNLSMKVTFLVLALALAVSAKTRRGPLPQIIREKLHDDLKTNEPRIVGGSTISISERPFQVGLEYSFFDFTFCGGSLIASDKVLTAAHCCDGESADDLKVRVGTDRNAEGGSTHMVSKVTMNPSYSSSTVANDACVLTLAESSLIAMPELSVLPPVVASVMVTCLKSPDGNHLRRWRHFIHIENGLCPLR